MDVTFERNSSVDGGGFYGYQGSPWLTNTTFISNTATGTALTSGGGGMFNSYTTPKLYRVTFAGNTAVREGGGMFNSHSSPSLSQVTFRSNRAEFGGGTFNEYSNPVLSNVAYIGNAAGNSGGAIHQRESSSGKMTNVIFSRNSANAAAGLYLSDSSSPALVNVTFSGNAATQRGGAIIPAWDSYPTLVNCILHGDSAGISGDEIYIYAGTRAAPIFSWSIVSGSGGSASLEHPPWARMAATTWTLTRNCGCRPRTICDCCPTPRPSMRGTTPPSPPAPPLTWTDCRASSDGTVDMGAYESDYDPPPNPLFVDRDAAGAGTGADWTDAVTDLSYALHWAAAGVRNGMWATAEVRVAEDVYTPTLHVWRSDPRSARFELSNGVSAAWRLPERWRLTSVTGRPT